MEICGSDLFITPPLTQMELTKYQERYFQIPRQIDSWIQPRSATNQSKIMIGSRSPAGTERWPPVVLNSPKDNSENAFSPVFAVPHNDAIAYLWGKTSSDSLDKADKQLGIFDVKNRSLTLAERSVPHEDIISNVLQQQIEHQRSMPIAGFPVPDPAECDDWQDQLNLKPTGFHIRTPNGEEPITRLDLEKNGDNRADDGDNNRWD